MYYYRFQWRCPIDKGQKVSIRRGSFFEKSQLRLTQIVQLVKYWAATRMLAYDDIMAETGLSKPTLVDWFNFIRDITEQWYVDQQGKLEIVDRRDAATLLPIIQEWVHPGTTVVSDGWAAYGGIPNLQQQYQHRWVNHQINFVDPNDPTVHTQSIASTWSAIKARLRNIGGTSPELLPTYFFDYMFRRYYKNQNLFNYIIYWIRHYYPGH